MTTFPKSKLALAGITLVAAGVLAAQSGVAQSAVNYFDVTRTVTGTGTANCPGGFKVTGGGFKTVPNPIYGSTSSTEYYVTGSYASSQTGWTTTGKKIDGRYSSSKGWTFTSWNWSPSTTAICTS